MEPWSEARVYVNGKEACFMAFQVTIPSIVTLLSFCTKKEKIMYWLYVWKPSSIFPLVSGEPDFTGMSISLLQKKYMYLYGVHRLPPTHVANDYASVCLRTSLQNAGKEEITIETEILTRTEKEFLSRKQRTHQSRQPFTKISLWKTHNCGRPKHRSYIRLYLKSMPTEKLTDTYTTRFGIRSIEFVADKGFFLNGQHP